MEAHNNRENAMTTEELNIANLITYYRLGGEFPTAFCVICRTSHTTPVWYCMG